MIGNPRHDFDRITTILSIAFLVSVPFAIWKLIEILIWFFHLLK